MAIDALVLQFLRKGNGYISMCWTTKDPIVVCDYGLAECTPKLSAKLCTVPQTRVACMVSKTVMYVEPFFLVVKLSKFVTS